MIIKKLLIKSIATTLILSLQANASIFVVSGATCPDSARLVTLAEAQEDTPAYCNILNTWDIARLGNGASLSGRGYNCQLFSNDTRGMGTAVCSDVPLPDTLSADALFTDDKTFLLSKKEWINIQKYVATSFALPTDENNLRLQFHMPNELEYSEKFRGLTGLYSRVKNNARTWRTDTYPASVDLAYRIYTYSQDIETYYDPLVFAIKDFIDNDSDDSAELAQAILQELKDVAEVNQEEAQTVYNAIQHFSANNDEFHSQLIAMESGFSDDQLNGRLNDVKTRLANAKTTMDALEDDYQHYVIVAATTPTYAWVPLGGWIAAPIVAGVFGDKAVKAMKAIHDIEDEIYDLQQIERHLIITIEAYERSVASLSNTDGHLQEAQESVAKIEAHWQFIKNDLGEIVDDLSGINDDLEKRSSIKARLANIRLTGTNGVIDDWRDVGNKAYKFMANAYATYND